MTDASGRVIRPERLTRSEAVHRQLREFRDRPLRRSNGCSRAGKESGWRFRTGRWSASPSGVLRSDNGPENVKPGVEALLEDHRMIHLHNPPDHEHALHTLSGLIRDDTGDYGTLGENRISRLCRKMQWLLGLRQNAVLEWGSSQVPRCKALRRKGFEQNTQHEPDSRGLAETGTRLR